MTEWGNDGGGDDGGGELQGVFSAESKPMG